MRVRVKNKLVGVAAVSMRTTLKYRRNWNKNGPAVKLLRQFMPTDGTKKGYRLFIDIGDTHKAKYTVPPAVRVALKRAGYAVSDYLAKKCVKIDDKEQKNVYNIGKVIAKDEHAKNAFDNDPQLQNSKSNKVQIVISCHPYDIIGMSTGRDWDDQSCMRLKDNRVGVSDGAYHKHVSHDVAEGTLVAYAIRADDTNIQKPLCRCLVKPFVSEDEDVLYRREGRVYGNNVPGFNNILNGFIRKLNAKVPEGFYKLVSGLYDDGSGRDITYRGDDGENDGVEIEKSDLRDQPELLVPYVKQLMAADTSDEHKAMALISTISLNGDRLHDEDLDEVAELVKTLPDMERELRNESTLNGLNRSLVRVATKAGFLQNQSVSKLGDMHARDHLHLAATGGDALRSIIKRLENSYHNNPTDSANNRLIVELTDGIMRGSMALPSLDMFNVYIPVVNYVYTIASAARFYPLWGETAYESQVHDLLDILGTGIPKILDDQFFHDIQTMGPLTNVMSLCVFLDNADDMDLDNLCRVRVDEAIEVLAERRPFKAFERQKSNAFISYMDRIKFEMFKSCMDRPYNQANYKPNRAAILEYVQENLDEVESLEWNENRINSLLEYHIPLLVHVQNNATVSTHKVVSSILNKLATYEGEPLDPGDNEYAEFLLRLAVFAGNNMDPTVRLNTKVKLDNLDNENFPAWYAEHKGYSRNTLIDNLRWIGYGTVGGEIERRGVVLSNMLPLIVENSNIDNGVNAWGSFSMEDAARNHRAIIKSIQRLPDMTNAIEALEQFIDSIELEETTDEEEGARALIDGGELGVQIDEDDDGDAYAEQFDEAREIISGRNEKILARNEKLYRMIADLSQNLGEGEEDEEERLSTLHYFFDKFSEESLEAHESEMDDIAGVASNKLSDLEHYYEEYRQTAGY